jgi:acyl carrier protein
MADDGLEGFIPAPLTTPCESSRDDTGGGTGAGAAVGVGAGTGADAGAEMKAIDPTGLPMCDVLLTLQQAVAECIDAGSDETADSDPQDNTENGSAAGTGAGARARQDPSILSPDVPLTSLGMDSMRGIQLQVLLESRFTVQLPDELMFEQDATLRTIAHGKISRTACVVHCNTRRNACVGV